MAKKQRFISEPAMSICVNKWKCLSDNEKAEWERRSKGKAYSGYNYFIQNCMKNGLWVTVYQPKDEEYLRILGKKYRKQALFKIALLIVMILLSIYAIWTKI